MTIVVIVMISRDRSSRETIEKCTTTKATDPLRPALAYGGGPTHGDLHRSFEQAGL